MAGLVPAIHVFAARKAWMPATSAGMTKKASRPVMTDRKSLRRMTPSNHPRRMRRHAVFIAQKAIAASMIATRIVAKALANTISSLPALPSENVPAGRYRDTSPVSRTATGEKSGTQATAMIK